MIGNPGVERKIIEVTYEDTCSVSRFTSVLEGSITKSVPEEVARGVICAISQTGLSSIATTVQTESENKVEYSIKLFCPPDIKILPGDAIEVQRFGRLPNLPNKAYFFESAGEALIYPTHQEIMLKRRERA